MNSQVPKVDVEHIPSLGRVESTVFDQIHRAAEALAPGDEEFLDLMNRSARISRSPCGDYMVTLYACNEKTPETSLEMDIARTADAIACISFGWLIHGQLSIL